MHEIVPPSFFNFLEQFRNIAGLLLILATELPSSSCVAEYDIVCLPEHFPINHKPLQSRGATVRYIANILLFGTIISFPKGLKQLRAPQVPFNRPPTH
jgi:hypothetical protein